MRTYVNAGIGGLHNRADQFEFWLLVDVEHVALRPQGHMRVFSKW
jgi:hypothetical protein